MGEKILMVFLWSGLPGIIAAVLSFPVLVVFDWFMTGLEEFSFPAALDQSGLFGLAVMSGWLGSLLGMLFYLWVIRKDYPK